jgi:hypothetical protein
MYVGTLVAPSESSALKYFVIVSRADLNFKTF